GTSRETAVATVTGAGGRSNAGWACRSHAARPRARRASRPTTVSSAARRRVDGAALMSILLRVGLVIARDVTASRGGNAAGSPPPRGPGREGGTTLLGRPAPTEGFRNRQPGPWVVDGALVRTPGGGRTTDGGRAGWASSSRRRL